MGASEERATLREQERVAAASLVTEMMIPGYGIWTVSGVKELLERRDRLRQVLGTPLRTQEQIASDMEMDRQAARDGYYNPNR